MSPSSVSWYQRNQTGTQSISLTLCPAAAAGARLRAERIWDQPRPYELLIKEDLYFHLNHLGMRHLYIDSCVKHDMHVNAITVLILFVCALHLQNDKCTCHVEVKL